MKKITILLLIFCLLSGKLLAQIKIGIPYFFDVYKPYTPEAKAYLKVNDQVKSHTYNFYLNYKVLEHKKIAWRLGLSYKFINHVVEDKIKTYYYYAYGNGTTSQTQLIQVKETLDLKSRSNSLGMMNELSYTLKQNEKTAHEFGLINEFYFLEFFKSAYYYDNSEKEFDRIEVSIKPLTNKLRSPFLFSSTNLSVFYRIEKHQDDHTLALRLNAGTNLYSDWDQFRQYAWFGVGLEIGFGDTNK